MSIKHATTANASANPTAAQLSTSAWNADHVGSNLAVKDEGVSLDSGVTSIDFTGAGVTATAVGHAVTVAVSGGGATPTLAEVLAAGNDTGEMAVTTPMGTLDGTTSNGLLTFTSSDGAQLALGAGGAAIYGANGAAGIAGANANLSGGYGDGGNSNTGFIQTLGGHGDGEGGGVQINPGSGETGTGKRGGDFIVQTAVGDGAGRNGLVFLNLPTSNPGVSGALFNYGGLAALSGAAIYSQAAGAPGGTLTTLLYGDTTAVTGGLYVWNGSSYRKVTGVLP